VADIVPDGRGSVYVVLRNGKAATLLRGDGSGWERLSLSDGATPGMVVASDGAGWMIKKPKVHLISAIAAASADLPTDDVDLAASLRGSLWMARAQGGATQLWRARSTGGDKR